MNDLQIAQKYISKAQRAKSSGIEFDLSFTTFKNMMRAKRCGYTGIELTEKRPNKKIRTTDRTIDRIDNNLGYISGNVVAVCNSANQIKSIWEDPGNKLTPKLISKMLRRIETV